MGGNSPNPVAPKPPPPAAAALHGTRTNADWESVWNNGGADGATLQVGERFDAGKSSPMLLAHLDRASTVLEGKRVLIPGCGRGYDVLSFARNGAAKAVGLDVAPTALIEARKLIDAAVRENPEIESVCDVESADFFDLGESALRESAPFDIVYDYTFLCAIDPTRRAAWAEVMARILAPGGELWTMIFPIGDHEGGPPFAVSEAAYESVLAANFEKRSVESVPDTLSHPGRAGREAFGVWVRREEA